MGILNMTFDSFFEGSRLNNADEAVKKAELLLNQGADILDLGGMSTRAGSSEISLDEELKRVVPTVEAIMKEFPEAIISVDTYRSEVAKRSVEAGASIINDISADRKSTRLNSSHVAISYAVFCLKKKTNNIKY